VPADLPVDGVFQLVVSATRPTAVQWLRKYSIIRSAYLSATDAVAFFSAPYVDASHEFGYAVSPSYKALPNLVRPEPALRFMGVEAVSFQVRLHLVADGERYGLDDVRGAVRWLAALNQPTLDPTAARRRYSPPPVRVLMGNVLRINAVVEHVTINWGGPWAYGGAGAPVQPSMVDVQLGFVTVPDGFDNFARGGSAEDLGRLTDGGISV